MARTIYVPEAGRAINFPDDASDDQIIEYLRGRYAPPPPAPPPEESISALESGLYSARSNIQTAVGRTAQAAGLEGYSQYLLNEARANKERAAKYQPEVADISQIEGIGDIASFAGSTIAQSAPETAVGVGGAYTGALIGAPLGGPVGAAIGAVIGGAIASLPSFVGSNLQRQSEERGVPLEETDLGAASVGAIAQAPLDAAFEALIARKLPGAGAALDVARRGFLREVAGTAGKGAVTEALTEPAQQAIELAQANPNKLLEFGPDVQREILNAAAAGALAGGVIGGGAEVVTRPFATTQRAKAASDLAADVQADLPQTAQINRFAEVNTGVERLSALPEISGLVLNKKREQPTPQNKLKVAVDRYSLTDLSGKEVSNFSDPVNAVNAVNRYQKLIGKKIPLRNRVTGQGIDTETPAVEAPAISEETSIGPIEQPTGEFFVDDRNRIERSSGGGVALQWPTYKVYLDNARATGIPDSEIANVTGIKNEQDFLRVREEEISEYVEGPAQITIRRVYAKGGTPFSSNAYGPGRKGVEYEDASGRKLYEPLTEDDVRAYEQGKSGAENLASVGKAGAAIVDNMYEALWDKTKKGDVTEAGAPSALLQAAKIVRDSGGLQSLGEFKQFAKEVGSIERGPNFQQAMRAVVGRYILKAPEVATEAAPEPIAASPVAKPGPVPGVWSNKDFDQPVEILPDPPEVGSDNRTYKRVRLNDGTTNYVPEDELSAAQPVGMVAPDVAPGSAREFFLASASQSPAVTAAEQAATRKKLEDRLEKISFGVRENLNKYGLKDVQTKFIPAFVDGLRARATFGSEQQEGGKSVITLAVNVYDPDLTVEQMTDRVFETLDRQAVHSLVTLGLLREPEMAMLKKAAAETPVPDKKYTYLERAATTYGVADEKTGGYTDPDSVAEQAVADMFRDWRLKKLGPPKIRGLINRIIEAVRGMFSSMKRQTYSDVFSQIETGAIGARTPAPQPRFATATEPGNIDRPPNPRLSVAPEYPYGQRVPQVTRSDNDRVIEELEYAAIVGGVQKFINTATLGVIPERYRLSKDSISEFVRLFADRMLPVGQLIDLVRKRGGTVTDALDVYQKAQLSVSITANNLENRQEALYKPLIEYLQKNGINIGDFEDYLYARHSKERRDRMLKINKPKVDPDTGQEIPFDPSFGSGMTEEDRVAILNRVDTSPQRGKILEAEKLFRQIIDDTNRLRIDAGLTPDFETMLVEDEDGNMVEIEMYKYYVPLRGFADEAAVDGDVSPEIQARLGKGFKIRGREDRRAFGRSSRASDIIAHAMIQNGEAVVRAEKNKVGLSLLALIEANPELMADLGIRVLERGRKPMKKIVTSNGVVKTMVDPMYKNRDDVLVVKRNGEEIPIQIDNPAIQKAMMQSAGSDPAESAKFVRVLGRVNRFLAAMNTVYNPEFALVNFPRDLQQALINISQYEIDGIKRKILKDALPAGVSVLRILRNPDERNDWSDWYKMFREDGGNTSGFSGIFSVEEQIKNIERMAADVSGTPTSRAFKALSSVKKLLEDYNGAFENAIRLAVYKNLVEANVSRPKAAFIAKNITVNFDQRGQYGPVLNSFYLFYNASVQGTMAMFTAAARSSKVRKALGTLVVAGALQDYINSLMSPEGDDGEKIYDKLPDYKLETNMILMDPFGLTESGYIAIPLPYGSNSFWNMGRTLSRNARGEYTSGQAFKSMVMTFVDAFNPMGGTESWLNFAVPTALDPVVALTANIDFSGRRVYPEQFPGSVPKSDSEVYFSSTSPVFVTVAQFLNSATGGSEYIPGYISISPNTMEYLFDYILGATGATARRIVDTATNELPKVLQGDLENLEINNVPVIRKVVGNVSERMSFEDYFEKVNHVLARGMELKSAVEEGDQDRIKAVREKYKDELTIYPAIKNLSNRRNRLASELRKIRENDKIPEEQKRQRMDAISKQIEVITAQVYKLYGDKIGKKYPGLFD